MTVLTDGLDVLRPEDPGYADAVDLFNAAIGHRPEYVVRPRSAEEVVRALQLARANGLTLSVRGGGHGVAGLATAGQVVLDLSLLRTIEVDPRGRTVAAGAGCTWADVDAATQEHGLATPGGRVTHTGIAGLTLGGGQGWLSPKHGLACDNLVAAEVVTAAGEIVQAAPGHDEDLLWALRGGGGAFGVVTRFVYRLHPVGPTVLGGLLLHPIEAAGELLRRYAQLVEVAGPDLGGAVVLGTAPPAPFVPPDVVGTAIAATTLAWFGDHAWGGRVLEEFRSFGPPLVDQVRPMPYTELQAMTDAPNPWGMRNYWSAAYADDLSPGLTAAMVEAIRLKRSPLSSIVVAQMGAGVSSVPEDASAFPHRDARWLIHPLAMWPDEEDDEAERAWVRATKLAIGPFVGRGTYLNTDSEQTDPLRVREVYGAQKSQRLAALKSRYDPDDLFRHAPGVRPS